MTAGRVKKTSTWRIEIDASRCQGHNRCYAIAQEVFDVDGFGQAQVRADAPYTEAAKTRAILAANNCPEFAISVVETGVFES
jgi:ferredoxin